MRRLILVFVLSLFATEALANVSTLDRRKTYAAGETLTANDLNLDNDHLIDWANTVAPSFVGDSIKVPLGAFDTLVNKTTGRDQLMIRVPLLSIDYTDSLVFHWGHIERLQADSLYIGAEPPVSPAFTLATTPGDRARFPYADMDSVAGTPIFTGGLSSSISATFSGGATINNVDIGGGEIDGTAIGANSALTGAFTTLSASGNVSHDGGTYVFNESSADVDARWEGNGEANLLYLDAGNDRVGIGTASPEANLHIYKADASQTSSGAVLAIEDDGDTYVELLSTNDGNAGFWFSDEDATRQGRILYYHSSDQMLWYLGGGHEMGLTATGNLTLDSDGTFADGDHQIEIHDGAGCSEIDASETSWTDCSSSAAFKDILGGVDREVVVDAVMDLEPIQYRYKEAYIQAQFQADLDSVGVDSVLTVSSPKILALMEADSTLTDTAAVVARLRAGARERAVVLKATMAASRAVLHDGFTGENTYALQKAINPTKADSASYSLDPIVAGVVVTAQEQQDQIDSLATANAALRDRLDTEQAMGVVRDSLIADLTKRVVALEKQ